MIIFTVALVQALGTSSPSVGSIASLVLGSLGLKLIYLSKLTLRGLSRGGYSPWGPRGRSSGASMFLASFKGFSPFLAELLVFLCFLLGLYLGLEFSSSSLRLDSP
jgi:hypothetical protein